MVQTQETSTPLNANGMQKPIKLNRAQLRRAVAMTRGKKEMRKIDSAKAKAKKVAKRNTQRASRKRNRV